MSQIPFATSTTTFKWLEQADLRLGEWLAQNRDDLELNELLTQAIEVARREGQKRLLGRILVRRSLLLSRHHAYIESLESVLEAHYLLQNEPLDDVSLLGQSVQSLLYRELGNYEKSLESCEIALKIARALAIPRDEVRVLCQLAGTLDHLERYEEAVAVFEQAELLARAEGLIALSVQSSLNLQGVYQNWGDSLIEKGEKEKATRLFENLIPQLEHTLEESLEHQMGKYTVSIYINLGLVHLHLENYLTAQKYQKLALESAIAQNLHPREASAIRLAGRIAQAQGAYDQAIAHHHSALSIFESLKAVNEIHTTYQDLERTYVALEDYPNAYTHAKEAHRLELSIRTEATERQLKVLVAQRKLEQVQTQAEIDRLRGEELERLVLERTNQLESAHLETLEKLSIAAEFRDSDTGQHTLRVGNRAAQVGEVLGLGADLVHTLRLAARLHDVGKIAISDTILHKPGKLTFEEYEIMKGHTLAGAKMLEQGGSVLLEMAEQIALSHHEKWDGTGYPKGLKGEEIPLEGRIVAVVDVLDALTSERPYKQAWTLEEAMNEIRAQSGRHFDPKVVDALEQVIQKLEGG